ncbi:MAG: DUF481 domain-containing protein [Bacteroidia bacterium]
MKVKSNVNVLLVFIMVLLTITDTLAQESDTLKYAVDFQVSGQRKRGVFSQTSLRVTANNHLETKKLIVTNLSSYTYTEANDFNLADDWHFRTIMMFKMKSTSRILPSIAHNYFKNVLYRINHSNRALAGLRILPFKQYQDFSFVLGAGYELSNYTDETFVNSPLVSSQRDFTLGFANISGKHKIGKNKILINYNLSYVQSFEESKDFSFWLTSGLSVPLSKRFSFGVNYDYRIRNVHLVDLPNINDLLMFNVKLNLSNS